MATTEEYKVLEDWADDPNSISSRCITDLRRRVEALEQRADAEQSSAPEPAPAPAPAADRPLWEVMRERFTAVPLPDRSLADSYAAEIDAVASWLDARGYGWDAAAALHAEARRAREGQ